MRRLPYKDLGATPIFVELPKQIENLALPDPALVSMYRQFDRRVFWVQGEINEDLLEISKMIMNINVEDEGKPIEERMPIKIYISSPGGDDVYTWNLVDTIAMSQTPVYTINSCMAMSNGLTLLVAGHKRFTLPHATALFHSGSAEIGGTKEQLDSASKYIASQDKVYEQWFLSKTDIDMKIFNRNKKKDWFLVADEMLKYKMVDKIVNDFSEIL